MRTKRRKRKRWTAREIERLKGLLTEHTISQAAKILRRTPASVSAKMFREKIRGFNSSTDYLSAEAVRKMLGVEHRTLRYWEKRYGLKLFRVGNYLVCRQEDLIKTLHQHPEAWNAKKVTDDCILSRYEWYWQKRKSDETPQYFWDEMQIFTLKQMRKQGASFKAISKAVHRSVSACKNKYYQMVKDGVNGCENGEKVPDSGRNMEGLPGHCTAPDPVK